MNPATNNAERNIAIDKTLRTEGKKLFDFIRKRVETHDDAEDILQDVFFKLVSSYSVTEPIEHLTSWLFTVARNRIIDWYRKQRHEFLLFQGRTLNQDAENTGAPLYLDDILFDPSDNPDELYSRSVVWRELADALDELPEEQRQVFVMHELEGKSFKEISDITGEKVNTLLSRKRYAMLYLRERLRELYNDMQNL